MDYVGLCHANHIISMASMEVHGNRKTCKHRFGGALYYFWIHPYVPNVAIA